ncbi:two-partner secretion domain-containing protein [Burkholderia sp. WSM2232]|uniref:two-partner secretion domain-containing protein n=1 Tax=Burkholderia sp. WSM2232 TaxID=944436 RepID=UPI0004805633|nr:filamentous hemagglutinin N-terminal domain-containing protein [Burkholderia sp. WSM2232]
MTTTLQLSRPARRAPHRRQSSATIWLRSGIPLAALCFTHAALAAGPLPQGGTYLAGAGAIANAGNTLVVTQPGSTRGVIEWDSFSVGINNSVSFNNGAGATLNRVTGGSPSAILGRLSATGSLYVINPQGIVVGPSGVVTTGGRFVASTLDICNCSFMTGGDKLTFKGDSGAKVINLGKISSSGGDIFLIARSAVVNAGKVAAPNGTAEMAVGENILLQDAAGSRQVFVQTGSRGSVTSVGQIEGAQVSLQAADGNVYALAGAGTRMRATGTGKRGGQVWLVADTGRVEQRGTITANNADGTGGTVDTQAAQLAFGSQAAVRAGQWNVSMPDFTIDAVAAGALRRSLNANTSVDVTTTGANGASGDLHIASNLRWNSGASLTLAAYRNVSVAKHATIANNGAGNLILRADASAIDNGASVTSLGFIDWSKSTGTVTALYDMKGTYTHGTLLANPLWTPPAYSGLGTQITGYMLVNSLADLENVATDLPGNYALGKNINANGAVVRPIGDMQTPFSGQFDGRGYAITSLSWPFGGPYIGPGSTGMAGLFGVIGTTGIVRNLRVNLSCYCYVASDRVLFGVLAAVNYGAVLRVDTSGSIYDVYDLGIWAGGLIGLNYGVIQRSSSSTSVTTQGLPAGLVSVNEPGGSIEQSYATGDVRANAHSIGGAGLVQTNDGHITQSYATGKVTFSPDYCGGGGGFPCYTGAAGISVGNNGSISQSFATGLLTNDIAPGRGVPAAGIAVGNAGRVSNDVYWNRQTTGAAVGGPGVPDTNGLSTAQMSTESSFVGYDFGQNGVWAMPAGATHPVLSWQIGP